MAGDGVGEDRVGARDIFAAIQQLIGEVAALRADVRADDRRLTEHMTEDTRRLDDHRDQIRSLQRRVWALPSGSLLIAAAALVVSIVGMVQVV